MTVGTKQPKCISQQMLSMF